MTNKEYLSKSLKGLQLQEDDIEIIMLKANINPEQDADAHTCDAAVHNRFSVVLKGMMANISEGGMSVSWNMEAVKMYYNTLCNELGVENVLMERPKVRNRSNLW